MAKEKKRRSKGGMENMPPLNYEQKRILEWLRKLRFKKKFLGGVSERDVWKKLEELNNMYHAALNAERVRYDALLEQERRNGRTGVEKEGGEPPFQPKENELRT